MARTAQSSTWSSRVVEVRVEDAAQILGMGVGEAGQGEPLQPVWDIQNSLFLALICGALEEIAGAQNL